LEINTKVCVCCNIIKVARKLSAPKALVTVIAGADEVKRGKALEWSGDIKQIELGQGRKMGKGGEAHRPVMAEPVRRNGVIEGAETGGV
jgi:hypothetical protein